jgi:hypothetical protein
MALEDELYKSLLDESKLYREKISTIWIQKFSIIGAIIVFAAFGGEKYPHSNLINYAFLSVPAIAILLDMKLAEFGIHARVIDDFIMKHFPDPPTLGDWERAKWGHLSESDRRLVRYRSISTVLVTAVPTCIISLLTLLVVEPSFKRWHLAAVLAFCFIYLGVGLILALMVIFRLQDPRDVGGG